MTEKHEFLHHVGDEHPFVARGLRSYFEYRDLGIEDASKGDVVSHVIKARDGHNATGAWHVHDCKFQMFYVLKGWAKFEYEGQGVHMIKEGDCVLQPPMIKHREIEHSEDLELIEVVAPANFKTYEVEAPES